MPISKKDALEKREWLHGILKAEFNTESLHVALGVSLDPDYDFAIRLQSEIPIAADVRKSVGNRVQELIPGSNPQIGTIGKIKAQGPHHG